MSLMPNFSVLSKSFPELKSKPWVEYLDAGGGDCREQRFNQLILVNYLLGDFVDGKTTFAKFLREIADNLTEAPQVSEFETVARAQIAKAPKKPNRKFLVELGETIPMGFSPSLFEILVRRTLEALPSRKLRQRVRNPEVLDAIVRLLAKEMAKSSPGLTKSRIITAVNADLKRMYPRIGTTDLVIEKMLRTTKLN